MPGGLFSGKVKLDYTLKSMKGLLLVTGHPVSKGKINAGAVQRAPQYQFS